MFVNLPGVAKCFVYYPPQHIFADMIFRLRYTSLFCFCLSSFSPFFGSFSPVNNGDEEKLIVIPPKFTSDLPSQFSPEDPAGQSHV